MNDGLVFQPVPGRTTTMTFMSDWPLSKPNRDLNGDQKAATIGGVRRHVLSSANRKSLWRRTPVKGSLRWLAQEDPRFAGRFGLSIRTKHVAAKLIAEPMLGMSGVAEALNKLGISQENHASKLVELGVEVFNVLQKGGMKNGAGAADAAGSDQDAEGEDEAAGGDDSVGKGSKSAIAAYGIREMQAVRELLAARLADAKSFQAVLHGSGKKKGEGAADTSLVDLLSRSDKLVSLWGLSRLERTGIDGALFGTMVTKHDFRVAAPSAVQVGHSITVHRAFDFETLEIARDDLEETSSAAMMIDASYASGLYLTSVTIDHAQLIENVMPPLVKEGGGLWAKRIEFRRWTEASPQDIELAQEVARALVVSILYTTDHAMQTQTNARIMPCYALAETGTKGTLNHAGAFTRPIDDRRRGSNSILGDAITRLREHAAAFDRAYGLVDARAELMVAPDAAAAESPNDWTSSRLNGADALADWVRSQVRAADGG